MNWGRVKATIMRVCRESDPVAYQNDRSRLRAYAGQINATVALRIKQWREENKTGDREFPDLDTIAAWTLETLQDYGFLP